MPARARKDISEDLRQAIITNVKCGSSYRQVAAVMGVSVGAVSAIMKVFLTFCC